MSVVERIVLHSRHDVQRVGLSAGVKIGTRMESNFFSYRTLGLSKSLAEEWVDRPQPLAAALAAWMRSKTWDKVEKKLECLKAIRRADLPLDRTFVLVTVVETG